VKLKRIQITWLLALAALPFLAGCGGINATHSVSPLYFLLPGLLKAEPPAVLPDPNVPEMVFPSQPVRQIAYSR
jgi:hypothetical protein